MYKYIHNITYYMCLNAGGMRLILESMPAGIFRANSSLMFIHLLEKYVPFNCTSSTKILGIPHLGQ